MVSSKKHGGRVLQSLHLLPWPTDVVNGREPICNGELDLMSTSVSKMFQILSHLNVGSFKVEKMESEGSYLIRL